MKRLYFLGFVFLSVTLNAQKIHSLGFKTGICKSHFISVDEAPIIGRYRFLTGHVYSTNLMYSASFILNNFISLSTDLGAINKGWSAEQYYPGNAFIPAERSYLIFGYHYISFNPNLNIKFSRSRFSPYLILGPLIDQTIISSSYINSEVFSKRFIFGNRDINLGIAYGIGFHYSSEYLEYLLEFQHQDNTSLKSLVARNYFEPKSYTLNIGLRYKLRKITNAIS